MTEADFLTAIRADPCDQVSWLALADWFDENGQSDRAELLRLTRLLNTQAVKSRIKTRAAQEERLIDLLLAGVRPTVAEITNSIGMRLALIAPGRFRMGSSHHERGRFSDEPLHEVALTRPYYLGVFAVTQGQYQAVIGSNPSYFSKYGDGAGYVADLDTNDFPVEWVSWSDSVNFCTLLSARFSERQAGRSYRLPTEAEWEFACRAGLSTRYPWGETMQHGPRFGNFRHPNNRSEPERTRASGSYLPNAFGIHDLQGNVWEWCADWFSPEYYEVSPENDPLGPHSGSGRVCRGSAYDDSGEMKCRSAVRMHGSDGGRFRFVGFRVAMTAST